MRQSADINHIYDLLLQSDGICTDTRHLRPDSLFVSLRGAHFDGNRFAVDALKQGCKYALVDDLSYIDEVEESDVDLRERLIYYRDGGFEALHELALLHRAKSEATFIAITGTNGKTTTKELVATVLSAKYRVHATQGNYNNEIGVPLTLLQVRPEHQFVIVELGASHIGDIASLCKLAQPQYGIITNVGRAHLSGFGTPEGVIKAKSELYAYLREHSGQAFCNGEDKTLISNLNGLPTDYYNGTTSPRVTGSVLPTDESGLLKIEWRDQETGESYQLATKLVGDYNLNNILAAITVGLHFGLDPKTINEAVTNYQPHNERSQVLPPTAQGNRVILDCYNANPSSMEVALSSYFTMDCQGLNRMLILGDMNELGDAAESEHITVIRQIQSYLLRYPKMVTYCCGPNFFALQARYGSEHFIFFPSATALKQHFTRHQPQHSFILIKGSNSHHLSSIAELC